MGGFLMMICGGSNENELCELTKTCLTTILL